MQLPWDEHFHETVIPVWRKIRVSPVQLPICQNHVRVTARVTKLAELMKFRK
jgi:hypothetical protein